MSRARGCDHCNNQLAVKVDGEWQPCPCSLTGIGRRTAQAEFDALVASIDIEGVGVLAVPAEDDDE